MLLQAPEEPEPEPPGPGEKYDVGLKRKTKAKSKSKKEREREKRDQAAARSAERAARPTPPLPLRSDVCLDGWLHQRGIRWMSRSARAGCRVQGVRQRVCSLAQAARAAAREGGGESGGNWKVAKVALAQLKGAKPKEEEEEVSSSRPCAAHVSASAAAILVHVDTHTTPVWRLRTPTARKPRAPRQDNCDTSCLDLSTLPAS